MTGTLEILSCGEGDLKVSFDAKNAVETERAKRMIQDMLKRGYAMFVHGKGDVLVRVKKFDAKKNCYIVATDALYAGDEDKPQAEAAPVVKRAKDIAVSMHKAKVTAVGRSAGG